MAAAQLKLGQSIERGDFEDADSANYWHTKAANQSNSAAQYKLGEMNYYGDGDKTLGIVCLRLAYLNGHKMAVRPMVAMNKQDSAEIDGLFYKYISKNRIL